MSLPPLKEKEVQTPEMLDVLRGIKTDPGATLTKETNIKVNLEDTTAPTIAADSTENRKGA